MTKQELIDLIYRKRGVKNGLTKKAVADIVDGVFAELGDFFVKAKVPRRGRMPRFSYPGFGTFSKRRRPEREGRHPRTGQPITIPEADTLGFALCSDLKELLKRSK